MRSKDRSKIADYLKCYIILETDLIKLPLEEFLNQCIEAGAKMFQLRNKHKTARENFHIGESIKKILDGKDVFFIINDRVDLALCLDADGVHLGEKDLPADIVKRKYKDLIIGYSCNNLSDINYANQTNVDYIGIGPAFPTKTKEDHRTVLSKEDYNKLLSHTNLPAVAIGGITPKNISKFHDIPISGFAVSSYICASENPFEAVKNILSFFHE
ncbi:thiamine-phosphate pyrophosphorylase [Deferribacter desulfuricans SSM1]|uniref:Thiamine-phosphate synthase n=1 Tax=Deferribacter desulfuricans (strain DSM 14783 / JCM 11476 / NBRC 101012 / SSM1) TaxID=639282 RepID=D3P8N4_DEFDS|nr:thiamine phosphate synthase [Deferribacter desulfuricans]BAI81074.1 thiamine-phosphate pyrophosphorylase [Deferribacter desulfuricans SSM1]